MQYTCTERSGNYIIALYGTLVPYIFMVPKNVWHYQITISGHNRET